MMAEFGGRGQGQRLGLGGQHALEQRAHDEEDQGQGDQQGHGHFGAVHDVVAGEVEQAVGRIGAVDGEIGALGELHVDDFDAVAAGLGIADGGADQGEDLGDFIGRARRIGRGAGRIGGVDAIDHHGDREALDGAGFGDGGLGGLGDLVIGDFFARRALFGGAGATRGGRSAGQLIGHGHLAAIGAGEVFRFADLAGADDLGFRVEGFLGGGGAVEVDLGGNLDAGAAGTDDIVQHVLDAGAQAVLEAQRALGGFARQGALGFVARTRGEEVALVVDNCDAGGGEALDGGRDQMLDGADFAGAQFAADRDDDGGRWLLGFAAEQLALGQDEVNPGRLDAGERTDGAGQFAFEGTDIVEVLHEAGGAQRRLLVEDFVADLAALRQARTGQAHARGGDLVARDQDGAAIALQLIGDIERLQLGDDGRGILEAEAGIERRQAGRLGAHDQEGEEAEHEHGHGRHRGQPRQAYAIDQLGKIVHAGTRLIKGPATQKRETTARQKLPT